MAEKRRTTNISQLIKELSALRPIAVHFLGKPREVHFFHRGTAEAFADELKGATDNESLKRRKLREVRLLSLVLADLHGSSRHFVKCKRWIWRQRLKLAHYNDIEAIALLEAASERMQHGKQLEALADITVEHIQAELSSYTPEHKKKKNNKH